MAAVSRRRRSQLPTRPARMGAPSPIIKAAMAIMCPPCCTLMSSECVMSLSVPPTTITPQPMTKLPSNKAQLAAAMSWRGSARSASKLGSQSVPRVQDCRVDDVGRLALDEVQQVVKGSVEILFVVVLLYIA